MTRITFYTLITFCSPPDLVCTVKTHGVILNKLGRVEITICKICGRKHLWHSTLLKTFTRKSNSSLLAIAHHHGRGRGRGSIWTLPNQLFSEIFQKDKKVLSEAVIPVDVVPLRLKSLLQSLVFNFWYCGPPVGVNVHCNECFCWLQVLCGGSFFFVCLFVCLFFFHDVLCLTFQNCFQ